MSNILRKCEDVINKHKSILEESLWVSSQIEILNEVKPEHCCLGKSKLLEGVICSETNVISIYPMSIWANHCGLLPEPYNWEEFEQNIVRVFAHEMRHLWQLKNDMFYSDNAEEDADSFACRYNKIYF